ncbi:MAG: coproporphyrinogen III oxidase [Methylococcales symbiont of Iophon sp. n. MRB-2018]|nr:MAG: coproporphyrinogen III oxidase [Methylococcales symbiont of Iophon sp. n. MRB-2018]KAF3979718.1 MAG: coproporphyrinogen III oxidase [Methylococcales symbiont of Iophon sp. n. MRB-2018]
MFRTKAQSINALAANTLVEELQQYFVHQLDSVVCQSTEKSSFQVTEWFRDDGLHGGGERYVANNDQVFNRASINVSQIHYDDLGNKSLSSATAISTIIHPLNPHAPSVHIHFSWTEMKDGRGHWRMMADLNPAIENADATQSFIQSIKKSALNIYQAGAEQGDRYFNIPALGRHRGVSHFYLEKYSSGNLQADFNKAKSIGKSTMETYVDIMYKAIQQYPDPTDDDYKKQLAYHTLYLFQVLTLDRGTSSGLLVHNQNDLGIMASLPAYIDKELLTAWQVKLASPQDKLLTDIIKVLPKQSPCPINKQIKLALAEVVRQHYNKYPKALSLQAQGNVIPL